MFLRSFRYLHKTFVNVALLALGDHVTLLVVVTYRQFQEDRTIGCIPSLSLSLAVCRLADFYLPYVINIPTENGIVLFEVRFNMSREALLITQCAEDSVTQHIL